jgi:hypothetical protein
MRPVRASLPPHPIKPEAERRVRALSAQGLGDAEIARLAGLHPVVVRRILSGPSLTLTRGDPATDTPPRGHGGAQS